MLAAQTINNVHSDVFTYLGGNLDRCASFSHVLEESTTGSLVYISDLAQLAPALRRNPAILIVHTKICGSLIAEVGADTCCFSARNISLGMAVLLKYFDSKRSRFEQWGARHPTAIVHPDAVIGERVCLGPYCVVGAHASVGEDCMIGSHVVIENAASIGARTMLHPHVFVGSGCEIGEDCEIHPHTTIGSDGFGYGVGADGKARKISHLGNVKIGDAVEIGGNCAIDRATLTSTYIRSGAKLDNICHIAHNCDLGEDGFYTAGFMMGGSTKIGRNFMTGGNSVVTAHVTIADHVTLQGRSSVTNDILEPGAYGGYPLQPLKEAIKTAVSLSHLNEIRKNLYRVLKHLNLVERCQSEKLPENSES
ncbi:MAG: UDP-3-O-(3-hydroxymyristoyl)glucosamine N-acyltransferase [Steroidobacteraceae bacterium]|jgi:UDP-3-O-[3-hydroxymyristoyl] glucosamine N-acyltransferase